MLLYYISGGSGNGFISLFIGKRPKGWMVFRHRLHLKKQQWQQGYILK